MPDPRFHPSLPDGLTYGQIALLCAVTIDPDLQARRITGVSSLTTATSNDLTYCAQKSFVEDLKQTKAGICLVSENFAKDVPAGTTALIVNNPQLCFAKVAQVLYPQPEPENLIHKTAVIAPTASISSNTVIGAYSVIGDNVVIGRNCRIASHCSITHAEIGDNTVIYAGARIGQDGFGYVFDPETARHLKVPQLGKVVIGNYVEIGANVTIDRGAMNDTVIGDGCIIDNLVQLGHNVRLGRGVILVAQSGIAGSSQLGDFAVVAAQGGIADHITIGDKAQVGAQAGVMRDIPAGARMLGSPAMPIRQFMRQVATLERLSERKKDND